MQKRKRNNNDLSVKRIKTKIINEYKNKSINIVQKNLNAFNYAIDTLPIPRNMFANHVNALRFVLSKKNNIKNMSKINNNNEYISTGNELINFMTNEQQIQFTNYRNLFRNMN
tara:strand:- start:33 stop:371 length:339 start_codon:yes stop_codon:yes gene_type:complete